MPGSEDLAKMSDTKIPEKLSKEVENYDKTNLEKVETKARPLSQARDMTLAGELKKAKF